MVTTTVPFNLTYWKNWPSEANPMHQPDLLAQRNNLLLLGLQKT